MPVFLPQREERFKKGYRQNLSLTIPNGHSISSDYIDLEDCWTLVGIYMPAAWTAANLGFYTTYPLVTGSDDPFVAVTGAVWQPINEPDSTDYLEIQVAAGEYTYIGPDKLAGCRFLRLWSVTDGTGVAQGAARTVILVVRPI
jgi:hypothetical protein